MTDQLTKDDFWTHVDDVRAGMFNVDGGRPVPMSPYADKNDEALWFITARGTDLESALRGGAKAARFVVAEGSAKLYATVDGTARLSEDNSKLEEIWNTVADAWFEGGKTDPDVVLVRFDLAEAEVWTTDGTLGFLYEIAKAQVTDSLPEMGSHGTVKFAA